MKKIDIVISYFNEDLTWIDELDKKYINNIFIYNKSGDSRYIPLPNIGLDSHTHLYHIVHNYDNLADATIFLQGNPFGHECEPRSVSNINDWLCVLQSNDHTLNYHISPFNGGLNDGKIEFWNGKKLKSTGLNISDWLYKYLDHPKNVTSGAIYWSSQFGVSRETILKNSPDLYLSLLNQHDSSYMELAHFMERSWGIIFNIKATHLGTRDNLGYFLTYHNLVNKGVEVGTFKGEFSKVLLSSWPGNLYMVDPWRELGDEYTGDSNHKFHKNAYGEAMQSIYGFEERAFMLRGLSKQMVDLFDEDSLDFVYIDGNHEYSFVKEDISLWYPKVKKGGIVSGHAYCLFNGSGDGWYQDKNFHEDGINKHIWSSEGEKYFGVFGVNPAVDEFCKEKNYKLRHTNEWSSTWFFFK